MKDLNIKSVEKQFEFVSEWKLLDITIEKHLNCKCYILTELPNVTVQKRLKGPLLGLCQFLSISGSFCF